MSDSRWPEGHLGVKLATTPEVGLHSGAPTPGPQDPGTLRSRIPQNRGESCSPRPLPASAEAVGEPSEPPPQPETGAESSLFPEGRWGAGVSNDLLRSPRWEELGCKL